MNVGKFAIVNGLRYGTGLLATRRVRSKMECALRCEQENSCSNFNYRQGHCELLSATCDIDDAAGWAMGYYTTGKCRSRHQKYPLSLNHSSPNIFTLFKCLLFVLANRVKSGQNALKIFQIFSPLPINFLDIITRQLLTSTLF